MAIYPYANYRPIAPGSNDPPIKAIGAILHVDAGDSKSLYGYFKDKSGGIESHFHVPKVGPVEQYRDTGWEADANLKANSFMADGVRVGFVSIETQGLDAGEWNAHQLFEIKRLLKWLSETHSFPLVPCLSPTSPGVGFHTMWGAPSAWTPSVKDCPGPDRIKQFWNDITPWMRGQNGFPEGHELQWTDSIPGAVDKDGSPVTIGEAIIRGLYSYGAVTDKSATEPGLQTRMARVEAALAPKTTTAVKK